MPVETELDIQFKRLERARVIARELGRHFEAAPDPVIVLELDGRFVCANEATVRKYGYSLEELLRMRIHDFQASSRSIDADLERVRSGLGSGVGRRTHRCKEGSVRWIEPKVEVVEVATEPYIVSTLCDVTDLVLAEENVRQSELRNEAIWRETIDRTTFGIALLDEDLRVVRVNDTLGRLVGQGNPILGRKCHEAFEMCKGRKPCPHESAISQKASIVLESRGENGRPLRVEIVPAQMGEAQLGMLHLVYDRTDENAARIHLVTSNRLATIGRLAAGVAHEVNNPAAFVTLALDILRKRALAGQASSPEVLAMIDEMRGSILQINRILHDLTSFARDEPAKSVDVSVVATSAVRLAAPEIRDRVTVSIHAEPGVFVHARGARLAQVVLNLLNVAAFASISVGEATPRVEVVVRQFEGEALIEIFAPSAQITKRALFEQRDMSPAAPPDLGFWLSQAMLEEERGTLECSTLSNGGTLLTVRLASADGAYSPERTFPSQSLE